MNKGSRGRYKRGGRSREVAKVGWKKAKECWRREWKEEGNGHREEGMEVQEKG